MFNIYNTTVPETLFYSWKTKGYTQFLFIIAQQSYAYL